MRTTYVLTAPILVRGKTKRLQLNGCDVSREQLIQLARYNGAKFTYRTNTGSRFAKEYKGIPIGKSHWGMIVWAKDKKDDEKLLQLLAADKIVSHPCKLPVERIRDKRDYERFCNKTK